MQLESTLEETVHNKTGNVHINVMLGSTCITTAAMKMQYILKRVCVCVCVCVFLPYLSGMQIACSILYWHVWLLLLCHIFHIIS